jgi:hypothetical protein
MIRDPGQLDPSRRLDHDREKQIELPDEPAPGNVHRHPHAARLTGDGAVEDVDFSDHLSAPVRVAIDRRDQGKTGLSRCRRDLGRLAVELPGRPHKTIPYMIPKSAASGVIGRSVLPCDPGVVRVRHLAALHEAAQALDAGQAALVVVGEATIAQGVERALIRSAKTFKHDRNVATDELTTGVNDALKQTETAANI